MTGPAASDGTGLSRREYLLTGGVSGVLAATAGCLGRFSGSPATTQAASDLLSGSLLAFARDRSEPVRVDPATTDRPVQEAMDILGAGGGGELRLPPATVAEAGPVRPYSNTAILGFGPDVSKVAVATPDTDGVRFDRDEAINNVYLDGFALNGPGTGTASGIAIHHVRGDTQNLVVGRLVCWGWRNSVYRVEQGVGPFQCRHRQLTVYECDAGEQAGLFEFRSTYGPANWFGTVAVYPTAAATGQDSTVWATRGGSQTVDHLTVGGAAGPAVDQTGRGTLHVETLHWEPDAAQAPAPAIARLRNRGVVTVGGVTHAAGAPSHVYELGADGDAPPGNKALGPYLTAGEDTTLAGAVVNLTAANDPRAPSLYAGAPADVVVTHDDAPTGGLRALSTAGTGLG
jgi:hypothetical protein